MLTKDAEDRISIVEVEDDPWVLYGDRSSGSLVRTNPS